MVFSAFSRLNAQDAGRLPGSPHPKPQPIPEGLRVGGDGIPAEFSRDPFLVAKTLYREHRETEISKKSPIANFEAEIFSDFRALGFELFSSRISRSETLPDRPHCD